MPYSLNAPDVAAQTMDGEALVIHFTAGNYFAFNRSGSLALDLLVEHGWEPEAVADELEQAFPDQAPAVRPVLAAFVQGLLDEGILVPTREPSQSSTAGSRITVDLGAWEDPAFTKYADLSDLLRLDPIHDVDEAGWPVARVDQAAP